MPKIIKVDTADKLRTLLTDVLPYELPLWFSNFTMYQRFSTEVHARAYKAISGLDFEDRKGVYIPLDYFVSRGGNNAPRTISIMHPVVQLKVCDFYNDYDDLIEYYCTKSKFSLRYPYRKTTKFHGKAQKGSRQVGGVEGEGEERIVASSYFKYKKYPFLYRFFESYEYHKLEKKFHSMLQVDVSKCFPSIYTHSVGWAVKSKRIAKDNVKNDVKGDFDGEFDNLMQLANYRETNGIIVGPEVSRIFAEIILQRIDLDLVDKMKNNGYLISKDYDFRRYVDDYFVFFRSEEVRVSFVRALESSLLVYKLYLNEAKTTIISRPFATEISLAKNALSHAVGDCYDSRYKELDSQFIMQLRNPSSRANKTISEIKMALANYRVEYCSISNYLFSAIEKRMLSYLKKIEEVDEKQEFHLNWLLVDLDVLFFVHAMDIRVRPTDRLARLIHDLIDRTVDWPESHREIIFKKIFDHVKQAINIFISHANDMIGLETLNLLIILTMLPEKYQLSESKLKDYFGSLEANSETNDFYFRWITFMLFIREKLEYRHLKNKLIESASDYLLNNHDMFKASEYFMFYFDYLACPYIDKSVRQKMLDDVKVITFDKNQREVQFNSNHHSSIVLNKDFIVSWRDPEYLKNSIEKKEYTFSYG